MPALGNKALDNMNKSDAVLSLLTKLCS